ncbi:MAG: alpha/beta hydrolase fold domain-containing protein [Coriobacteriales bacterium]|nr:alpha/beta hydrolase fold domain-containing protein [Coriobacteriales bacterium]
MSVRYKLAKPVIGKVAKGSLQRGLDHQKLFLKSIRAIQNRKTLPLDKLHKAIDFDERKVGATNYYAVHSRKPAGHKLVLFLFGGGYCMPGGGRDFRYAQEMADETGAEVWLVWYPLLPDATGYEIAKSVVDVFEVALASYSPGEIAFYGNSSGAALCLSACVFMRKYRPELPLPSKLVTQSPPLRVPPTSKEREVMLKRANQDMMIPARLVDIYLERDDIFDSGGFDELASPIDQSWMGFPRLFVLYGGDEVFLAYLPALLEKCKAEGVELSVYVGKGGHSFSAVESLPEHKIGRQKVFEFLNHN